MSFLCFSAIALCRTIGIATVQMGTEAISVRDDCTPHKGSQSHKNGKCATLLCD